MWVLLRHRRTRMGVALILGGLLWVVIAVGVIMPHFSPAGVSPFINRYGAAGSTTGDVVKSMLRHPEHQLRCWSPGVG